ncbi:Membrane protein involved in the export of O-antigen and teichoic acid [Rhizobium sp. RU20A]|uniref:lipopolysaccharide biosynthesis protein n=1 Tax=Rhizobium sp. RU20A TaxID=1907412 RepID=UPI0009566FFF|nr:lipopolysaccharide biosynthesis protein [Rhizobium sp. RU20A]SIQ54859.1 Membrane protein involved in the export of O-antigen and teichoic acid [Rhizobium sp. RU20A]
MLSFLQTAYARNRSLIRAYVSMTGGSAGRLVLSLVYFICVANTLSIDQFGLFATASAAGIILSRGLAFGFMSPLYRVATVKPHLIGTYTLGFLAGAAVSLPLLVPFGALIFHFTFASDMTATVFATFMLSEVVFWRGFETVVIVLNGLGRFGAGAWLVIIGTALRTLAALAFSLSATPDLAGWSVHYLVANAASLAIGILVFYPRVRLRWQPRLYLRRWADSVTVAGAEVLFYVQSEFDKIVVLAVGGPAVSGLYAIMMRLADLTALPVRSFNTLLVQRIMRAPQTIASWRTRLLIEAGVFAVSLAAIASMAIYLHIFPSGLGRNVAEASPYIALILLVPAFRNLVEYQSELLYATGRTARRAINLVFAGGAKIGLLALLLVASTEVNTWAPALNGLYAVVYALSFALTYTALRHPVRRVI